MQHIALVASFLLIGSFGCHGATPHEEAEGDSASTTITSAILAAQSDDEIASRLKDAMLRSGVVEPQSGDVQVSSSSGIVTLKGRVGTAEAKQRIHDLAQQTPGVKAVVDELEAPEPNPSVANDAEITQSIRLHLSARNDDRVEVTTLKATVTLEGSVPTEVEKSEIEKLARNVPNVMHVDDRLVIRPLSKP